MEAERMEAFTGLPRPALMGIVNVTPNSFSDGYTDAEAAVAHAKKLVREGASILDVGAEASSFFRKGVEPVGAEEQLQRLRPVLAGLLEAIATGVRISVDTRSAVVARECLQNGAHIINDISAGTHDPDMLGVAAEYGAGVILMHMAAQYPATPVEDDADIVGQVRDYLQGRAEAAMAEGIPAGRIGLDPGVGFGKTMADNWRLALRCQELRFGGQPYTLVLGVSRKRFLEMLPPDHLVSTWETMVKKLNAAGADMECVQPRDAATAALTALTEAHIHRVHHVTLARAGLRMA
jgi:dihydropteroate synthase